MKENESVKKRGGRSKGLVLPLLPLRGITVFPHMILHFDVGRAKSVMALEAAMADGQQVLLVAQINPSDEEPAVSELYKYGCVAVIKQLLKLPGGGIRVLVEGQNRAKIGKVVKEEPYLEARVTVVRTRNGIEEASLEATTRQARELFEKYFYINNKLPPDAMVSVLNVDEPGTLADIVASHVFVKSEDKQEILQEPDPVKRLQKAIAIMYRETEILELGKDILSQVKENMGKIQREYFLREQIKVIQKELGDKEGVSAEVEEYRQKIAKAGLPEEGRERLLREVDRLEKMPQAMGESAVVRTYLDTVLELPWSKKTRERFNIKRAEKILNSDHYGLEKVKERILEYLSVRQLAKDIKGQILCLVGPPGVGKTSVAKSIAQAMGRNYVRMSLGGIRDEAEIRGHRKTYVGAMPGRIINAVRQAGSRNAFVLLDEIDKISNDFRGDPYSALLEVLDGEQNFAFRDHYVEIPFDLSDVFFVTTANSLDTIPRPLLDRMEVIRLSGYTEQEKEEIAARYLVPRQREVHGLKKANFKLGRVTIKNVISDYTRESGVRQLEREIASICRKSAKKIVESGDFEKKIVVTPLNLDEYLGKRKYNHDIMKERDEIGVATGLAWTSVGGDILSVEANVMPGSGKVELTGHLGDVMKESAQAAISYIRSRAVELGIGRDFYKDNDIHIHVPEGATPKDGPSAGITIATALISALTSVPVRRDVAMTGEITLRGRVLPIGGLKEKVLAAHRAGIRTVIIPLENEKDLEDVHDAVREVTRFVSVEEMGTVIKNALITRSLVREEGAVFGPETVMMENGEWRMEN